MEEKRFKINLHESPSKMFADSKRLNLLMGFRGCFGLSELHMMASKLTNNNVQPQKLDVSVEQRNTRFQLMLPLKYSERNYINALLGEIAFWDPKTPFVITDLDGFEPRQLATMVRIIDQESTRFGVKVFVKTHSKEVVDVFLSTVSCLEDLVGYSVSNSRDVTNLQCISVGGVKMIQLARLNDVDFRYHP